MSTNITGDGMFPWTADHVERWPIGRVQTYGRNARVHSAAQIEQIAASIREWGFTMPVLVDEAGILIAGHARTAAARQLGLDEIPVMIARGWSKAQIRAYRLADNKLAMNATWAEDFLKLEFGDLKIDGFDLLLTGWDKPELDLLLTEKTKGKTDPDALPTGITPRVSLGDVWTLGEHVLHCADCRDVFPAQGTPGLAAIGGVVTDPPYGIGFDYGDEHDDTDYGAGGYGPWIWSIIEQAEALCAPGAPLFVWQSAKNLRSLAAWFPRDWRLVVGARSFVQMTKGAVMHSAYDAILAWWKPGADPWTAGETNRDWHYTDTSRALLQTDNIQRQHPCPRPVEQVQYIIEQWVAPGATILEPFCGSGTTLISAEMTGRACIAIEKSPVYCDIAITRWEEFTGKEAIRHVE